MSKLVDIIKKEYERRVDIIYNICHPGQYWLELQELKEDIEKTYNCKITGIFEIEEIQFNK